MRKHLPALLSAAAIFGCAPERDCAVELWHIDAATPDTATVSVVGDFNGWDDDAHPMKRVQDGAWTAVLELPPGDYDYMIRVDGIDHRDPFAALLGADPITGEERSRMAVADCAQPLLELEHAEATARGDLQVQATFLAGDARFSSATATLAGRDLPVERSGATLSVHTSDLRPGKHTVLLDATDRDGRTASLRIPLWVEERPFSWEGAVLYQVVLDRFAGPEGALVPTEAGARFGGTLAALTEIVEQGYFDDLGVSALWVSPLYRNPTGAWPGSDGRTYEGYHGYWPISPDEVEPALGTEADVHELIEAAHARGLRVLMDVVPNHVHEQHPYRARPEWFHDDPDCICGTYTCPWQSEIETCWFTPYLPDLALERADVARTVVADTVAWATRFDFDGFRVDAVPMMSRPAVRALVHGLRAELEQGPTPFFLVGETFTGAGDYDTIRANLGPFGLNGQFEFPIMWAIRDFVAYGSGDAEALDAVIDESEARWAGSGAVMSPFIGNHDTSRFLSEAAGHDTTRPWDAPPPVPTDELPYRKQLIAQAYALSLPGAPVLYYGDELGLAGANDPDCRRAMVFDPSELQQWTRDRVARLGRARKCSEALRTGRRTTLLAEGPVHVLQRATPTDTAVLAVNASDANRTLDLDGTWFDVVEREDLDPTIDLPPWSARLLLPAGSPCIERTP